jgi:type I restriction enzyme, S subunit
MPKWPTVRFEELADKSKSSFSKPYGSAIMKEDYLPSGVPVVRGVNLRSGIFIDDDFVFISDEQADRMPGANLTSGDLVFTHRGTIGQVSMIPRNRKHSRYVLSTSHVKARLDGCLALPEFYYYYFTSPQGQQELLKNASVVGVPGIAQPVATIKALIVPHPPFKVQEAIAAVLGTLDGKIALNKGIAGTARKLARVHVRSFIQAGDAEVDELSSIVEFLSRGVTPHYSEDNSQLRLLNQKCIRDHQVNVVPSRRTVTDKVPAAKMLQMYDVLVNSTGVGTLGRVARWTRQEACTVDSHVTIVRFDAAKVDPVCAGFAMLDAEPEIEALGEGSTGQTELSRAQLSRLRITVPSRDRADRLRPLLDALESRGDFALEESDSLVALRTALLPKLMSGEIRVRDAEKVVEEVT